MTTSFRAIAVLTVLAGFVPLTAAQLPAEEPAGVVRITDHDGLQPVSHDEPECLEGPSCEDCPDGVCGDGRIRGDGHACGDGRCNGDDDCSLRRWLCGRSGHGNGCHASRCQYCAAGPLSGYPGHHGYGQSGYGQSGYGPVGCYERAYPTDPYHFDARDGRAYSAYGYGVPMAVPLAPTVHHTYNYGWGIPSSRITPVSRMPGM